MSNFAFCFRPTEAIDLKHETMKRVAEKLTNRCTDEMEKALGPRYLHKKGLSSTEEQAR